MRYRLSDRVAIIRHGTGGEQVAAVRGRTFYIFNRLGSKVILSLEQGPKTPEEISKETGIPLQDILEFLERLLHEERAGKWKIVEVEAEG